MNGAYFLVYDYPAKDEKVVWYLAHPIPKNVERTMFAALYFRLVGQG
jgi:hypothetical protein